MSYKQATARDRQKKIVYVCLPHVCSGIADRVRGLPFTVALSIATNRQLIVHQSILGNHKFHEVPKGYSRATFFHFGRGVCNSESNVNLMLRLANDTSDTVFVAITCAKMPAWDSLFTLDDDQSITLKTLYNDCSTAFDDTYLCGAGILHQVESLKESIREVKRLAESLELILPQNNYTTIQIRTGGSNISIDNVTTKALPWRDGYGSPLPQIWIDEFRNLNTTQCKKSIAVVSDSARVIAELQYGVFDKILITHCCNQPLHRYQSRRKGFFFQEVLDLFIMARSKHLIASAGEFTTLGRYWLGRKAPTFTRAKSKEAIQAAVKDIIAQGECVYGNQNDLS